MHLKMGLWKMNTDGFEAEFTLESVSAENIVHGTIGRPIDGSPLAQAQILGFWEETSRTLTFSVLAEGSNPETGRFLPLTYKGFLFNTPRNPSPGQDIQWTLAGFLQVSSPVISANFVPPVNLHAKRNIFGWFAQITEIT